MKKLINKAGRLKIDLQDLKESEARFRSIVFWSPDAIIVTDAKGKIEYINPAAERVFNRKVKSYIGTDFGLALVDGESAEIDIFRPKKDQGVGDMRVVETEWLNKKAHLITIRDITKRKQAEEEALRAGAAELAAKLDRQRTNELLSVISHELRTPLTPIKIYASLFLSEKYGKLAPKYLEAADVIKKESTHLQALIEDFLDVAHLVGNVPLKVRKKQVAIKPILDELLIALRAQFAAKGMSVAVSLPESFSPIFLDAEKIRIVFSNLLVNALKFNPKGSWVKVIGEARDKDVLFRVIDNGIGLAPENRQRIFDKFFQVDSSNTRSAEGMGMGLAIAKEFVEIHGGKIWAESEGLGKGTQFYFTLPLEEKK